MTPELPNDLRSLGGERYEVLAPIGTGTAASVFRVRDRRTAALRAAKVLRPENAANRRIRARFEDEFRILRTLHHPHLPEVYDYGWTEDGGRFLIMELVDGVSLGEHFSTRPDDLWAILYELCETLTFVHNHKLLHQDIKPSNILIRRTTAFGPDLPLVKLIDFGLIYRRDAKATVELVGSPDYVAPEVVRGDTTLTRAVDYYSLGATLCELLTGRPPFAGTPNEVLRAHVEREPEIVDEHLEWAELYGHVRALLTKDARARLEAFEELRRAVVTRLTGGIEELDRAYGRARIDSLPMIGKADVWKDVTAWFDDVCKGEREVPALRIEGEPTSGIGFMIDALGAEASIAHALVVRLGTKRDRGWSVGDALGDVGAAYQTLLRSLQGPCALVCVDCDTADEKEMEFARYVEALRTSISTASVGLILYGELPSQGMTAAAEAQDVYVEPLARGDYEPAIDIFRGSTSAEDIKLIGETVARAKTSGGVVDLLRRALESDALTFRGGRWAVRRDMPQVVDVQWKDDSNARAILASLPKVRQRLLACIACADYPVPVNWLLTVLNTHERLLESDLQALVVRRLVNISDTGARSVSPSNTLFRDAARALLSDQEKDQFHRALANRLELGGLNEDPVLRLRALAAHYEQLGKYRELAQSHLRAIRILVDGGLQEEADREYQRGLVWFSRPEAARNYAGSRHIHRFYVKRYLNSLWSRNLYARARRLLRDAYVDRKARVPRTFWPKYVRSTLDIDGPPVARKLLRKLDVSKLRATHELRLLMGLEDALVSFQEGNRESGLKSVRALEKHKPLLRPKHRHRLVIYEAMCIQSLGEPAKAAEILRHELPIALADGSIDEAVLMQAICASITIYGGDHTSGLREISRALRLATKHRLYLRVNALYRLAASVYVDAGKYHRAIRAQLRAMQSSHTIGALDYLAIGWQRLAGYERAMGMFANAIRYIERARVLLPDSGNANHWSQINRLRYELATALRRPERHELARRSREWKRRGPDVSEQANVQFALGQYEQSEGRLDRARLHYESARELGIKAGMIENAVVAAGAELRVLYELGWNDAIHGPMEFILKNVNESSSVTLRAERCIAAIWSAYASRKRKVEYDNLVKQVQELWDDLENAKTRSDIALMLFRLFARQANQDSARHWAALYSAELRRMLANLTDPTELEGVAKFVGADVARSEIAAIFGRPRQYTESAHRE